MGPPHITSLCSCLDSFMISTSGISTVFTAMFLLSPPAPSCNDVEQVLALLQVRAVLSLGSGPLPPARQGLLVIHHLPHGGLLLLISVHFLCKGADSEEFPPLGHAVSVSTAEVCQYNTKAARDDTQTNQCSNKPYLQNLLFVINFL